MIKSFLVLLPVVVLLSCSVAMQSCSDNSDVIDPSPAESTALLRDLRLSEYVINTDTVDVDPGTDKSPDDPITIHLDVTVRVVENSDLMSLTCTVLVDGRSEKIAEAPMEETATADTYQVSLDIKRKRGDVGDYRVEVNGVDGGGLSTNTAISKLKLFYGSGPPVLSDLSAPDTITRPQSGKLLVTLSVRVTDPSGPQDIKIVFFNTFLPDGRPSSGNPFEMYDSGSSDDGDEIAGDGIYSTKIELLPDTEPGPYRFEFRAVDYSNLSSNVITHTIIVL